MDSTNHLMDSTNQGVACLDSKVSPIGYIVHVKKSNIVIHSFQYRNY